MLAIITIIMLILKATYCIISFQKGKVMNVKKIKDVNDLIAVIKPIHDLDKSPIQYKWVTGGVGGSHADYSDDQFEIEDEGDPESEVFGEIVEFIAPTINAAQYNQLTAQGLWFEKKGTDFGKYGDYADYIERTLNVDILFERLTEIYTPK